MKGQKYIKQTIYRTYEAEFQRTITNVIHDLPTWMFPEHYASKVKMPCPICHKEMRLNIAHGQYIEKCSMIQLDDHDTMPIHTECFNNLNEAES